MIRLTIRLIIILTIIIIIFNRLKVIKVSRLQDKLYYTIRTSYNTSIRLYCFLLGYFPTLIQNNFATVNNKDLLCRSLLCVLLVVKNASDNKID